MSDDTIPNATSPILESNLSEDDMHKLLTANKLSHFASSCCYNQFEHLFISDTNSLWFLDSFIQGKGSRRQEIFAPERS